MALATSSSVMPPKKRHSTIRARRSSRVSEALESAVDPEHFVREGLDGDRVAVQGRRAQTAAPFAGRAPPRIVDEDLTHRARGECEEVVAVLRLDRALHELHERLMDERGRGQGLSGTQPAQLLAREPSQLAVGGLERVREGAVAPGDHARQR